MPAFVVDAAARSTASAPELWARLTDWAHWPEWNADVRWAVLEGPLEPGSFLTIQPLRGRQTAFTIEVAAAPSVLLLAIRFGPLGRIALDYRIGAREGGTLLAQRLEISGLLEPLLVAAAGKTMAAAMPANLERLARAAAAG